MRAFGWVFLSMWGATVILYLFRRRLLLLYIFSLPHDGFEALGNAQQINGAPMFHSVCVLCEADASYEIVGKSSRPLASSAHD